MHLSAMGHIVLIYEGGEVIHVFGRGASFCVRRCSAVPELGANFLPALSRPGAVASLRSNPKGTCRSSRF